MNNENILKKYKKNIHISAVVQIFCSEAVEILLVFLSATTYYLFPFRFPKVPITKAGIVIKTKLIP